MLEKAFDDAIEATKHAAPNLVCSSHDSIRLACYALCMKARADLKTNGNGNGSNRLGSWIEIGKKGIVLHGGQAILAGGLLYALGKVHQWW